MTKSKLEDRYFHVNDVARLLGISQRSARAYLNQGAPVKYVPNKAGGKPHPFVDPEEWIAWRSAQGMKPFKGSDELGELLSARTPIDPALEEAAKAGKNIRQSLMKMKLAKLIADTKRSNLAFEIQKGAYIPRDDVQRERLTRINHVKRGLLQLPSSLAPNVVGETIEDAERIIKEAVYRLLREFAKGFDGEAA